MSERVKLPHTSEYIMRGTSNGWGEYVGELIRCKDCKHWDGYFCHNKWWGDGYGNYTPPIKKEDGFCDWAERKEE